MGATLAREHHVLVGLAVEKFESFYWCEPRGSHLAVRRCIRGAVAATAG
jgi:hypothetical protein